MPKKTPATGNKAKLRRELIRQRRNISEAEQKDLSWIINRNIINSDIFRRSSRIALYISCGREVNIDLLLDEALLRNKLCYLPALSKNKGKDKGMDFLPVESSIPRRKINKLMRTNNSWRKNFYGIYEPNIHPSMRVALWTLDAVFMPLSGFDTVGGRLGMGGGYYDRCFAFCVKSNIRPLLIGVGFGFQEVPKIPISPWDLMMNYVVTEKGWLSCNH